MHFTVQRSDILTALQMVMGVVEKRQTMPILSNVLVQGDDNCLVITATDLELELVTRCPAAIGETGSITIPARKFLDICRGLPNDAEIECERKDGQIRIRSGHSRFTLASLQGQDWPHLDEVNTGQTIQIREDILKKLLERTHFAMAHQDVRYYLNGLLVVLRSDLVRCVATDGHRLALSEENVELALDEPIQAIVPRKAISELVRLLGTSETKLSLSLSDKHLSLQLPALNFTTKLIDARFPDYERVIPSNPEYMMCAQRDTIRQGLARTAILSNEKFGGVRLSLSSDKLRLQAQNTEREEAEDEIAVSYDGQSMEIGFNVSYLQDALAAMQGEEFRLLLSGPDSSGLLKEVDSENSLYVVMPMRL